MCTALALARRGYEVKLLERDTPPPLGGADRAFFDWPRRGAAQFRHPHAFLGLMCNLLKENYPALLDDFYAAGARRLDFKEMLSLELESRYHPEPGDDKLWVLLARRAVIETVMRRYVERQPNITINNNIAIDGVVVEEEADRWVVQGLKVRKDCEAAYGAEMRADIIVDASGRTSRFPRWFKQLGRKIPEENDDAELVYFTRHYRLNPGTEEPPRGGKDRAAGDLGYIKFGVFPGDNRHFAIIVCVHNSEKELLDRITDGDTFDALCRNIPGLAPWLKEGSMQATTAPFGFGDIRSVWRHYVVDGSPVVENFFAVGDACLRTNPLYGRGCSTSILHAHMLAEILDEFDTPVARALAFDERTETELRPIFEASLSEDKSGIRRALASAEGRLLEAPKSFRKWLSMAFGDALSAAARYNLHVLRGMMRTVNLLEKPGAFLQDKRTRLIILLYMFRGRTRNAAARIQRGPSRAEMLTLIRETARD